MPERVNYGNEKEGEEADEEDDGEEVEEEEEEGELEDSSFELSDDSDASELDPYLIKALADRNSDPNCSCD